MSSTRREPRASGTTDSGDLDPVHSSSNNNRDRRSEWSGLIRQVSENAIRHGLEEEDNININNNNNDHNSEEDEESSGSISSNSNSNSRSRSSILAIGGVGVADAQRQLQEDVHTMTTLHMEQQDHIQSLLIQQQQLANNIASSGKGKATTTTNRRKTPPTVVPGGRSVLKGGVPLGASAGALAKRLCEYCGTASTPMWRRGPSGVGTLCNRCGVQWRHGKILAEYEGAGAWLARKARVGRK